MACDFIALANKGVQGLTPYVPGKPVEELERELGLSNIVKLASNENPLGMSERARQACQDVFADITRYPDGNGFQLKSKLASRLSVQDKQITLGNGSNDVLELIVRAFADSSSEVIFSQYAFAVYYLATVAAGAKPVVVPAVDWGHDLDAMAAAITEQTKIIFIANPNNPTGTWLTSRQIEVFMQQVPEHVLVVLDEAYCEYIDQADFPDGVGLLSRFPNVIVTRTFSKAWGLAGLRVGYGVSDPVIADVLNRVRQPFNVNSMALAAATAVLDDDDYLQRSRAVNTAGLAQIAEGLADLGLSYIPSVGNFICFDTGGDGPAMYQQLLRMGVIVRPVANYGMPAHLRVSVGTAEENDVFLRALRSLVAA